MGFRPLRFSRISNKFAAPGTYASHADAHGPAGHHTGIDFAGPIPGVSIEGRPIRSSTPGEVVISEFQKNADGSSTMGHWVGVYFAADDVLITYWHMRGRNVQVGDHIMRGKVIGWLGQTGNADGPHTHVQANHGRDFDYSGHIAPGHWVRGRMWAGMPERMRHGQ
jgi:murein DD-endopeptidase MepM/ murein hydrolase activator NlpD